MPTKKKKNPQPAGRKPLYKPEYCEAIIEYMSNPPMPRARYKEFYNGKGDLIRKEAIEQAPVYPTVAGFAASIGTHKATIYNWKDEYPEFFDAFTRAMSFQEQLLVSETLGNNYNAQFARLIASTNMGYVEKQAIEITQRDPETQKDIDDILQGYEEE